MRLGVDEALDLVAGAYRAATEPDQWPSFLERLRTSFDATSAGLQIEELCNRKGSIAYSCGHGADIDADYARHYSTINPWVTRGASLLVPGRVAVGEQVISRRELERTEFHADFLRRIGVLHSLAAVAQRDEECVVFLALERSARQGEFDRDECSILERVLPHICRAVEIQRKLGAARQRGRAFADTAEALPWGILFFDHRRRIVFANRAARALSAAETRQVLALVNAGGGVVPREDQRPLAVTIAPLAPGLFDGERICHAVLVVDPDADRALPIAWLRDAYGLTTAEARIAIALAGGDTVESIARSTTTRISTVRTHLRRVFAKTATRSQADLVRLVLLGAPPII